MTPAAWRTSDTSHSLCTRCARRHAAVLAAPVIVDVPIVEAKPVAVPAPHAGRLDVAKRPGSLDRRRARRRARTRICAALRAARGLLIAALTGLLPE